MATRAAPSIIGSTLRPTTIRAARPAGCQLRALSQTSRPSVEPKSKILLEDSKGLGFIRHNERPPKPRSVGVTEIRGPYYSAMGKRYLSDILET